MAIERESIAGADADLGPAAASAAASTAASIAASAATSSAGAAAPTFAACETLAEGVAAVEAAAAMEAERVGEAAGAAAAAAGASALHAELEWSDAARAEAERRAAALQGECEVLQLRVEQMAEEGLQQREVGLLAQEEVQRHWALTLTPTTTPILTLTQTRWPSSSWTTMWWWRRRWPRPCWNPTPTPTPKPYPYS